MRTKCKKYKIRFRLSEDIHDVTTKGVYETSVVARSPQGAEKFARQHSKIFKGVADVLLCEIEYKNQTGVITQIIHL